MSPTVATISMELPILICSTVSLFLTYMHISVATFIAFNRYVVLSRPLDRSHWSLTRVKSCMLAVVLFSLLGIVHRVEAEHRFVAVPGSAYVIFRLLPFWTQTADACASAFYGVTLSLSNIVLQIRALLAYRRLSLELRRKQRDDFLLFDDLIVGNMGNELSFPVYSAFEFLLQLAVGVYAVVKLILLFNERLDALQPLQEVYVTTLDLMLLSPPIVLFLMSSVLRRKFSRLIGFRKDASTASDSSGRGQRPSPPSITTRIRQRIRGQVATSAEPQFNVP
ncbi:hypothetical protein AAVH_11107 [Aphelenchoides avenae]|nr:hypothetical protein AAVH_11107 [Aphelenchus avenae]